MRDRDLDRRGRVREVTLHDGFLRHRNFRWLKVATFLSLAATVGYVFADVKPRPNGGSWYGYTLGTIGVLLILWLTLLGVRKRWMTRGRWSLKAWTSAHGLRRAARRAEQQSRGNDPDPDARGIARGRPPAP